VWLGPAALLVSLWGTTLLGRAELRPWAVVALVAAGVLGILAWGDSKWFAVFAMRRRPEAEHHRRAKNRLALGTLTGAALVLAISHVAFLYSPNKAFGLAGSLWLAGIALVIAATKLWDIADAPAEDIARPPAWTPWEMAALAGIVVLALALRIYNLKNVPFNIYPDEIMTGVTAEQAYLSGSGHAPSIFSTLWSDVELPALWFAIVAGAMKLGGVGLVVVRLPAALFGAATILPFYGLVRSVWGRASAITGASIVAFSAVDVHYSRMGLNNITTPFFWTLCFFFLLRGLRSRRPTDWTLAGLAGGLSEHFYYGTRLLPFILIGFVAYLLVVYRRELRRNTAQFGWLALGYLAGFGPLLTYFAMHPGFYYGRGAGLLTWNRFPANWQDLHQMWNTLWPIMSENLLGISTHSAQDIMYFAPLLLVPEAALLVLGVALLVWRWRHPAAFLLLLSGLSVLFVGGTLVLYPNSAPPMPAHWTPAFPAFYAAIAVPAGAWVASAQAWPWKRWRWLAPAILGAGLFVLGCANLNFYFNKYYADPASLRIERYKRAQTMYEVQTIQSRYMASLGSNYRVVAVGKSPYPYDADMVRYLVQGQEYITLSNPEDLRSLAPAAEKGLVFLFFPGSEEYRRPFRERYPDDSDGEVRNPLGKHLFYTLVVPANK
jgi:4-amino-4-deoxy-L-arabinose transferase-like glycosyltransferase